MRDEWLDAPSLDDQKAIARRIQAQVWQDTPFIPLGQYFVDSAWRRNLTGIQRGMTLPINVRRV